MLGSIIGAGANIIGGILGSNSAKEASNKAHEIATTQMQMQKDFAQHGIKWKVKDAKEAGIHPLYALGANTPSFSPVSYAGVADNSLGTGIAAAGQDISRALNATRTDGERQDAFTRTVQQMTLQKMGLENEMLASQIAKLRQTQQPPMPIPEKNPEPRPVLLFGGNKILTDPTTSNAQDWQDRYGDEGPASWASSAAVMWRDYLANQGYPLYARPGSLADRFGPSWLPRSRFPERR